jgi:hypothetical protein
MKTGAFRKGPSMDTTNTRFLRQLDIVPPEKLTFPITVIGAGAIGSATVVCIAKMGCSNITIWDDDNLNEHNIPNQLCKPALIGRPKVEALAQLVYELSEVRIRGDCRRYAGQNLDGVVIVAIDNMSARQAIWKRVKGSPKVPLLIDARMGAEFARIYTIRPVSVEDGDFYAENLYPNTEAERLPCSAQSIIYCPTVIAGLIALQIKLFATNQPTKREILFDLPSLHLIA